MDSRTWIRAGREVESQVEPSPGLSLEPLEPRLLLSAGLIGMELSTPQAFAAGAGLAAAEDVQTLQPGSQTSKWTFTDADGDRVTVALQGRVGSAEIVRAVGPEENGDIVSITLNDTNLTSGLTITTNAQVRGKVAETTVGGIEINGSLGKLTAKTTDLTGSLTADGIVKTITLDDAGPGASIEVLGAGFTGKENVTIKLDQVADTGIDTHSVPMKSLTATEWTDTPGSSAEQIRASRIDSLTIKGDKKRALAGDLQAGLALSGSPDPKKNTLGKAKIAGIASGDSEINGNVGTLAVQGLHGDLHIAGNAKSVTVREPTALAVAGAADLGQVSIDGNGTVKASNGTTKGTDFVLGTRDSAAVYRLEDLRRYDVLGAWWRWQTEYTVKVTGEPQESGTAITTINVADATRSINGHDCSVVTTSTAGTDIETEMAWYTDATGTYLAEWVNGALDLDLDLSTTWVAPQYVEVGETHRGEGTISGDFTVYDPFYGNLEGIADGTVATVYEVVGHEMVSVGGDTYLAAKAQISLTMKLRLDLTADGEHVTATGGATLAQTYWAVPDIGIVKAVSAYTIRASVPGEGTAVISAKENSELLDYGT